MLKKKKLATKINQAMSLTHIPVLKMWKSVAKMQISNPSPTPIQVTKVQKTMSPTTRAAKKPMSPSIGQIWLMPRGMVTTSIPQGGGV